MGKVVYSKEWIILPFNFMVEGGNQLLNAVFWYTHMPYAMDTQAHECTYAYTEWIYVNKLKRKTWIYIPRRMEKGRQNVRKENWIHSTVYGFMM